MLGRELGGEDWTGAWVWMMTLWPEALIGTYWGEMFWDGIVGYCVELWGRSLGLGKGMGWDFMNWGGENLVLRRDVVGILGLGLLRWQFQWTGAVRVGSGDAYWGGNSYVLGQWKGIELRSVGVCGFCGTGKGNWWVGEFCEWGRSESRTEALGLGALTYWGTVGILFEENN